MDLTGEVSCIEPYEPTETPWSTEKRLRPRSIHGSPRRLRGYGIKHNIPRLPGWLGCRVTVVPARSSAARSSALRPDGNLCPRSRRSVGNQRFAIPVLRELIASAADLRDMSRASLLALALDAPHRVCTECIWVTRGASSCSLESGASRARASS